MNILCNLHALLKHGGVTYLLTRTELGGRLVLFFVLAIPLSVYQLVFHFPSLGGTILTSAINFLWYQ